MSVFLSSGSPRRSVPSRRFSLAMTASCTLSCTSRREPAQHTWPWLKKMPLTMPSTAWSIGASSNTMLAALPPSSSDSRLPVPASVRWICLPTSVEPVKATLSTPGCCTSERARLAGAGDDVDDAGGQVDLLADVGEGQRRERRGLGRLEHDGVAARQRRRDLPRQHQQREVPRDDLTAHADRLRVGAVAGVGQLVGPAGVVEEVGRHEGQVDVAGLLDRLAVVDRLQHGQLARALLDGAGDAVQVLGPLRRRPAGPTRAGARRAAATAASTSAGPAVADLGQHLLGGRVDRLERDAVARARRTRRR